MSSLSRKKVSFFVLLFISLWRILLAIEKKSILSHPSPQELIDKFAGKGMRVTELPPGVAGYQEIVDCGECIGYVVNADTGEKIATNWGKIHYAKDGVHIVPTKPRR